MATFFCRKLFADSRIRKWDLGLSSHLDLNIVDLMLDDHK